MDLTTDITSKDINLLISCNILCFNEIRLNSDLSDKHFYLINYNCYQVKVTRCFSKGRASEGLATIIKNYPLFASSVLISNEHISWVCN